jgi:hypothetical protein
MKVCWKTKRQIHIFSPQERNILRLEGNVRNRREILSSCLGGTRASALVNSTRHLLSDGREMKTFPSGSQENMVPPEKGNRNYLFFPINLPSSAEGMPS